MFATGAVVKRGTVPAIGTRTLRAASRSSSTKGDAADDDDDNEDDGEEEDEMLGSMGLGVCSTGTRKRAGFSG